MKLPSLPPPPCAPCSLETFSAWATEVIALLQPHSMQPSVANGRPVRLLIRNEGTRTLGVWSPQDLVIRLHVDHAIECCRRGTADLIDTLLHECAHMLSPAGSKHNPLWRRIATALGATPRATAPADLQFANPPTEAKMPENTLTPDQISGAAPLPAPTAGHDTHTPSFDIKAPYHLLAEWVAHCIPPGALYRQDNKFITIHTAPGGTLQQLEMTRLRLPTWLPAQKICTFHGPRRRDAAPDEPPPVTSISAAQAELILASDALRNETPELLGTSNVRLPIITSAKKGDVTVRLKNGTTTTKRLEIYTFEPSLEGYDKRSKIFTHSTVSQNFDTITSLEAARKFIISAFSESALDGGFFSTTDKKEDALHPLQSRSLGAVVVAMLGQFLHHNIDTFPMIMVIANQPGCGKSFLVKSILAPIFGEIEASNYLDDDKEFRQTLNAALFDGARYFFLDDVKSLNSPALNRFITSTRIRDRILHTQTSFVKDMRMQFFTTGNRLQSTPDIARRSIPIDLFWSQDATQRQFQGIISEHLIITPAVRAGFLRALWSMVKHWEQAGCPRYIENAPGGAFRKYVDLTVNIAMHAGFANPYGPRLIDLDAGDSSNRALMEVLITLADTLSPASPGAPHRNISAFFRVAEIEQYAERMHKIDIIVPRGNNKRDTLGIAMRSLKGREFTDSRGRLFSVGSKRDSASSRYLITILTEPTRELSDAAAATLSEAIGQDPDPDPEF